MYSQSLMSYAVIKERYHERLHSSIEITKEDFSQLESASNLHLVYFRYMSRFKIYHCGNSGGVRTIFLELPNNPI